jgi:tetratricopeptide (TPR) repeat protein
MKKKLKENPNAELIAVMGKKSSDRKHFRSVINLHDKAIKTSSDQATDYAKKAIAIALGIHTGELEAEDIKQCKADLDKALKINNELPVVKIAEGCYYYYCKKNYQKAIASFTDAFKKDPKNYKPIFYLIMVNKAMGNWKEVKTLLKSIVKFKINNPLGLTNIGLCFEYLHDFDNALDFHQRAINNNQDWEAANFNKFRAMLLKNDSTKEAHKVLNSILEKSKKDDHPEYQIILDIYDGKYSDAFDKSMKAKNNDFPAGSRYIYLGNISLLLKDKKNSEKYFNSALKKLKSELEANPNNADLHSMMGLAHAGKRNKAEALSEGKKAVTIARNSGERILEIDLTLNLAKIYSMLEMQKEAIETIEEVLNSPSLFSVKVLHHDPVWKSLLKDEKLKAIIKKYDKVLTL